MVVHVLKMNHIVKNSTKTDKGANSQHHLNLLNENYINFVHRFLTRRVRVDWGWLFISKIGEVRTVVRKRLWHQFLADKRNFIDFVSWKRWKNSKWILLKPYGSIEWNSWNLSVFILLLLHSDQGDVRKNVDIDHYLLFERMLVRWSRISILIGFCLPFLI